ncbi:MAG: hypothetical protein GY940_26690 [bacterium]|nr:hypothetical protein [bacterium]
MFMYCPECKCEYLESVRECVDCGVKLVKKLPEEPQRPGKGRPGDILVEIRSYPGMGYGLIVRDLLVQNGIDALLMDDRWNPTERIMVPQSQVEKADKLIIEFDEAALEDEGELPGELAENPDENES